MLDEVGIDVNQPQSFEITIKSIDDEGMTLGGYGVIWGGRDLVGDFFTKDTDFWFDRITENPIVLYDHGQDEEIKKSIVGRVSGKSADDWGLWVESQIEKSNEYFEAVQKLVEDGRLGYSSGAIPHLVERKSTGEITSWAIAEFSLTTTPAEPRTLGVEQLRTLAETEPAYKAFLPDESEDAKASEQVDEDERKRKLGIAKLRSKRINFNEILEENQDEEQS
ncbi:MAG: hypothetical protein GWN13_03980 [Phycisphaerae bacterium]|nr:hypothetical protein [Phycisphaerae bacterium]